MSIKTSAFFRDLVAFWRRHSRPSPALTHPEERFIARTLALTSVGSLVTIILPALIFSLLTPVPGPIASYLVVVMVVFGGTYVLSRTRHYRIGLYAMLLALSAAPTIICLQLLDLPPTSYLLFYTLMLSWNVGALIVGALLLERPAFLVLSIINMLSIAIPARVGHIPSMWFYRSLGLMFAESALLLALAGALHRRSREIAQSEQRFRDLFRSTLEGLVIHDGERILAVNPAFERMFRCKAEEVVGIEPIRFVAPEARVQAYQDFLASQDDSHAIIRSVAMRFDGTRFVAEAHAAPVVYEGKQAFALSVRDISKQIAAEEALKAERDLLRGVLESIADPFYVIDAHNCHIIVANDTAQVEDEDEVEFGYAWIRRQNDCAALPEECPVRRAIHTQQPVVVEHLHERMVDGRRETYFAEIHTYPIVDEQGEVQRVIIYAPDITARKEAEAELRKLSRALEYTVHGVVITNKRGEIEYVNPAFTEMTGYTAEEAIGQNPRILKSGKQDNAFYEEMWRTILAGHPWQGELINRRKDGTLYWEMQTIAPVFDENGEITHFVAVKHDITEKKRSEEAIRKLQRAVDQAAHSVVITDRTGTIEYVNPAFTKTTGYTLEEAVGQNPRILKSDKHPRSFYQNLWNTILKGETWYGEFVNRRKDGTLYWERASIAPVKDEQGRVTHFVAVKENITHQKELEEALRRARDEALQASRLKTQLLGNVSHDMRTPLGGILGYSEMLLDGAFGELNAQQRKAVLRILQSTQQLAEFTNDLLNQAELESGRLRLKIQLFDPQELLKVIPSSEAIAEAKGVQVHTEIDPELPQEVYGDPYWLRQILANLLSNAVKFTDQGHIWVRLLAMENEHWAIQVEDTGAGIPKDAQSHIFEPFRQVDGSPTRRYKGSGLGLSIVKQLVELMHGEIRLESTVGKGSKFTVILPCQATLTEEQDA